MPSRASAGSCLIAAIDAKLTDTKPSPRDLLDWSSRAFWVSPSLVRFESVGYQMEEALLSSRIKEAEFQTGKFSRPPNPEFDAMKGRLAQGLIPSDLPVVRLAPEGYEPLSGAIKRAGLPQVRPSFFRSDERLLAIPLRPFKVEDAGDLAPSQT
jgi:hypothetical protein